MTLSVRISPQAARHIREAKTWWIENRPSVPTALVDDVEDGLELIAHIPGVGEPVHHSTIQGVRRLLLSRIRYHVYYLPDPDGDFVDVLAFWHTSRGSTPELG